MTLLDAPPVPEAPAPQQRRRRWPLIALVAALVATGGIAGTVGALQARDAARLAQVHVFLDARPFVCSTPGDATTAVAGGDGDASYRVPAVKATPGLDCRMSVVVRNDADADVEVDRIVLPWFGPRDGTGVRADLAFTQGLRPTSARDGLDAVVDYEHDPENRAPFPVAAGTSQRFDFRLRWSGGCIDDDATFAVSRAPRVTVSTGGARVERDGEGGGYAVVGTPQSRASCLTR